MSNVTIIGSGIGARSVVKELVKKHCEDKIIVYSKDIVPYSRMAILDVLKKDINKEAIKLTFPDTVEFRNKKEAIKIDASNKTIIFKDGASAKYEKLIIATGATPKKIEFGKAKIPIFTIRDIEDVEEIDSLLQQGRTKATLLGGGFINMEMANALYKRGCTITIVVSSPHLLSRMLPPMAANFIEEKLTKRGIRIIKGTTVERIENKTLYLQNNTTLESDFLIIGKGVERNLIPVLWEDKEYTNYNANTYFQTPFPDIYLIGDALMTKDLIRGEIRHNAIWPVAVKQGVHLAKILSREKNIPYKGDVAYNMLSIFDMFIFVIGDMKSGAITVNLKTENSLFMIAEKNGRITGILSINHPLPFAKIVKKFMEYGHY